MDACATRALFRRPPKPYCAAASVRRRVKKCRFRFASFLAAAGLALAATVSGPRALAADDDILFTATLTDDEQSVPTVSPGVGFAEVRLERATMKITWKVTYKDLTSPPRRPASTARRTSAATPASSSTSPTAT